MVPGIQDTKIPINQLNDAAQAVRQEGRFGLLTSIAYWRWSYYPSISSVPDNYYTASTLLEIHRQKPCTRLQNLLISAKNYQTLNKWEAFGPVTPFLSQRHIYSSPTVFPGFNGPLRTQGPTWNDLYIPNLGKQPTPCQFSHSECGSQK